MKRRTRAWAWMYPEGVIDECGIRARRRWVIRPYFGAPGRIVRCTIIHDDGRKPKKRRKRNGNS